MQKNNPSRLGFFNPRALIAFVLSLVGALLAIASFASPPSSASTEFPRDSVYVEHRADSLNANAAAAAQWSIVVSPNIGSTDVLLDVTCISASDCWAVGYYIASGNKQQTLVEHWDGIAWSIVMSPNTSPTRHNILTGVTCASPSDCWAVGYGTNGIAPNQTLIQHWDGNSWSIVTSPNPHPQGNGFFGVTCSTASDCWAVGHSYSGSAYQTLIEHWDGTSWDIVFSPNLPQHHNLLYGVTCASASDCWAVGFTDDGAVFRTLVQRWNGTVWTIAPSPNAGGAFDPNVLRDVTCISASDCWAVGETVKLGPDYFTLIEHWDGISWTVVSSPNISTDNVLEGVTCTSASDCWAVGETGTPLQTLIEHWDGTSWAIVVSPNTSTSQGNFLWGGVTCASASDCWAVGSGAGQTLTMRYTASPPPIPDEVVSRKTHGTVGHFDIDLPPAGTPGIECRSGGANENYQIVFTFPSAVTVSGAAVTPWTDGSASIAGPPSISPNGKRVTVNLADVSNAQTLTITLTDVNDGTNSGNVAVPVSVLLGDTTGNGTVNSSDIAQTKSKSGQTASAANFRTDVTVSGTINSSDIGLVKSKSGTALP